VIAELGETRKRENRERDERKRRNTFRQKEETNRFPLLVHGFTSEPETKPKKHLFKLKKTFYTSVVKQLTSFISSYEDEFNFPITFRQ
jgi:hypothetical protein